MSFFNFLKSTEKPKTIISGDKKKDIYFNVVDRNLLKYQTIYRQGGIVSQAIDAYPLFGLSAGYNLIGQPKAIKDVTKWFHQIGIDQLLWQAWIDALVYGDSIAENVYSRAGELLYCVPRNPLYFSIDYDNYGIVQSYTQRVNNHSTVLKPEQITCLTLLSLSGEAHGLSLIGRTIDDVMRDTRTAESTAIAIERHGFPRFHVRVGGVDSEYSDDDKKEIAKEFEKLKADNEFITNSDISILPIDAPGVGKIAEYNQFSLTRMLGALGVPSGVLGAGQNTTTWATASVEVKSFILRVESQQMRVSQCFNNLIDLKLKSENQVSIVFNKIAMGSEVEAAAPVPVL